MKKLVLSSLMSVLVAQAAGCIIESGDDGVDPPPGEYATIQAQWSLKSIADNATIPYPPGITTAAVYSQEVDANYQPVGDPIIDLFDVGDNAGRTAELPPSVYQVWVELTSEGGSNVHARSLSAYVDVIDTDKTFTTTLLEDGGYFQFQWDLVDAATNAPLSCAEAASTGVDAVSTLVADQTSFIDDTFNCEDQIGITGGMYQGAYTVSISALDANDQAISTPINKSGTIQPQNAVTNLGAISIPIN